MSERIAFMASTDLAEEIESEADNLGLNKSEVIRNHLARSIVGDNYE